MGFGDLSEVYRRWVEDYYQDVYRWCFRYVGNSLDAQDLTQETFTNAFRYIETFRGDASARTWLLSIATRAFLQSTRRAGRDLSFPKADVPVTEAARSAEAIAVDRLEKVEIWSLVRTLPDNERIAIALFYGEDLSYNEIAEVMNVNLQQVRNYIHRGRKRLQNLVGRE